MLPLNLENQIFSQGYRILGALDEAGRGPLAGPVVAACVILTPNFKINDQRLELINDSKKVTPKRRAELYELITQEFDGVGVGICDHETIDRINILEATFLAMKKALGAIKQRPDFIVVDGKFPIPNISVRQQAVVRGDSTVFSIAAASIIAKVARDRIMDEIHQKYPNYGFDEHRGYGTKKHMAAIKQFGPCEIHRKTFAPIKDLVKKG